MEPIIVIDQAIYKCVEYNEPIYVAFEDYKNALDSEFSTAAGSIRHQDLVLVEDLYKVCTGRIGPCKKSDKEGRSIRRHTSTKMLTACLEGALESFILRVR